jgi:hypothetical protein
MAPSDLLNVSTLLNELAKRIGDSRDRLSLRSVDVNESRAFFQIVSDGRDSSFYYSHVGSEVIAFNTRKKLRLDFSGDQKDAQLVLKNALECFVG